MKKVKYEGSLTDDLRFLRNNKTLKLPISKNFFKILCIVFSVLTVTSVCGMLLGLVESTLLISLLPSISLLLITRSSTSKFGISTKSLRIKTGFKIEDLSQELISFKQVKKKLSLDNIYTPEEIRDAVVIERDKFDPIYKEYTSYTKADLDAYLDTIISDIYFVNDQNKIAVLREIKEVFLINKKRKMTKCSTLYQLEAKEMPKENEMPVKQTLELRDNRKKRIRI